MDMNVYGVYLIMGFNKRILNILFLFYYYKLVNNSFFIFLGFLFDVCEKKDF